MKAIQQAAKARVSAYKGSPAETNRKSQAFGDGPENYFRPQARPRPVARGPKPIPNFAGGARRTTA